MRESSIRKRFMWALVIFTALILSLWFGYYAVTYESVSRGARENAGHIAKRLLDQVGAEFSHMKNIAAVIAGSSSVQEFLSAGSVGEYYSKAEAVTEIIHLAAYPISSVDSVITINASGDYYRFTGGLSSAACDTLYDRFKGPNSSYTVIELDGTMYFCHSAPVFKASGQALDNAGTIIILTNLNRTRSQLISNTLTDVDTAVIQGQVILISSDEGLEGKSVAELDSAYGMVVHMDIAGTVLSVAAAVKNSALLPEITLFLFTLLALLLILLLAVAVLYQYLSRNMVKPMAGVISGVTSLGGELDRRLPELPVAGKPDFESLVTAINGLLDRTEHYSNELLGERQKLFDAEMLRQNMQIGLLVSQIDAHFVVNAIVSIGTLSARGDNERAGLMADGLAQLLKHRHSGDALCNVFVELEMIEKYVGIMNIRYEGKFIADYDVPDELSAYKMPGLILQPVVENALTHGLQNKEGQALLNIRGYMDGGAVILEVSDNGAGIAPEKMAAIRQSLDASEIGDFPAPGLSGVSLINVQRRIRLRFGDSYGLSLAGAPGGGTQVTIKLPAIADG